MSAIPTVLGLGPAEGESLAPIVVCVDHLTVCYRFIAMVGYSAKRGVWISQFPDRSRSLKVIESLSQQT
jgi:hypothetical protein